MVCRVHRPPLSNLMVEKPLNRSAASMTDGMLDIAVVHVVLDRPSIMAVVGKLDATSMAQHVGMDRMRT